MASLRAPMPSDVLFSTDNVGSEQKIKKVFTPSDVLFSTEKYRWRANEKKLVSRSGLSSKRCNAPQVGHPWLKVQLNWTCGKGKYILRSDC